MAVADKNACKVIFAESGLIAKTLIVKAWRFGKRLCLGVSGQVAISVANFLLAVLLMLQATPEVFGTYAFIQTIVFFGFGISNATLSSPIMAMLNREASPEFGTEASHFRVSILTGMILGICVFTISYMLFNLPVVTALLFGFYGGIIFMTRLGRTYLLDNGKAWQVLISDYAYAIPLIIGTGWLFISEQINLENIAILLFIGSVGAFIALGRKVHYCQLTGLTQPLWRNWQPFWRGFKAYGRHALVGVLSTEATGRSHAYIVTLWLGPVAFAPLAAAMLFFRPVQLILMSLAQFERGRIARLLRENKNIEAWKALRFFNIAIFISFVLNVLLVIFILSIASETILAEKYDINELTMAVILTGVITMVASIRTPLSTLLQANGDFRLLSYTTLISSVVTIPAVFIMVATTSAVWSLSGVMAGQIIAALLIIRLARKQVKKS